MRVANRSKGCITFLIGSWASLALAAEEPLGLLGTTTSSYQRLEIEQRHTPQLTSRLVFHDSKARWAEADQQATLSANILLRSAASLVDFHPFGNGFRITTGFFLPEHTVRIRGRAAAPRPGAAVFDTMSASATIHYTRTAPYLGIGWSGQFGARQSGRYGLDIGIVDHGIPEVELALGGTAYANLPSSDELLADAAIRKEVDQWKEELSRYRYFPVVTLSLNWRF